MTIPPEPSQFNSPGLLSDLNEHLKNFGMSIIGGFHLSDDEVALYTQSEKAIAGLMIINHGPEMWRSFESSEYFDGQLPNPMDRWTTSVLNKLALRFEAGLVLPFERPYPPFQGWAKRAIGLSNSPLGILIHPRYGLWFGFRGVLLFEVNEENQDVNKLIQHQNSMSNPCDNCVDKPCLNHCPVSAFSNNSLNVEACFSHLGGDQISNRQPDCLSNGCSARAACPVGNTYQYDQEQLRFHMGHFFTGRARDK